MMRGMAYRTNFNATRPASAWPMLAASAAPYSSMAWQSFQRYATRLGPAQRIRVSMVIPQRPSRWTPSNKGWV